MVMTDCLEKQRVANQAAHSEWQSRWQPSLLSCVLSFLVGSQIHAREQILWAEDSHHVHGQA